MQGKSYKQIAEDMAAAIKSGEVPAGTRLPTHRALARRHHIATATATRVYTELAARGLTTGEPGRGTYVRELSGYGGIDSPRRLPVPRLADLSFSQPRTDEQTTHLRHALRELSTSGNLETLLYQQPPGGRSSERATVATYLLGRGIDVPPERVMLTNGAQQGLDSVLAAITSPGDVIAADALTYPGLSLIAASRHLEIAAVPSTGEGPDLVALEQLCSTRRIRGYYANPTVHNPLGWSIDHATRQHLIRIARTHDITLVEDGTYAFLDEQALRPLQSLAPERTFHVASLSKSAATGLRFGFVVSPSSYLPALARSLKASSWGSPGLISALATRWIADGTITEWEKHRRDDARTRQHMALTALHGLDYTAHPTSFFGWLSLPEDIRADHAASRLAAAGILVSTSEPFSTTAASPHALRLALAAPALDELPHVLSLVHDIISSIPS